MDGGLQRRAPEVTSLVTLSGYEGGCVVLSIGVGDGWLPEGLPHVPILFPFWGIPKSDRETAAFKRFDELRDQGSGFLRLTSVRESDVAVLPFDWHFALSHRPARIVAERAAEEADKAGRKILVFFFHDSEAKIPLENSIVFRTSMQRGARPNEFAHPAWVDDYVGTALGGAVPARPKWTRPTVGCSGFAGYRLVPGTSLPRRLRAGVRAVYRGFPPLTVREKAILALRRDTRAEANFVLRENFCAGVADGTLEQRERAGQVFVNNLIGSDYVLCARGGETSLSGSRRPLPWAVSHC